MLYAVVTATALIASCYLLFRQGNAFARDVTPPLRLRRWAAAFFITGSQARCDWHGGIGKERHPIGCLSLS